MIGSGVDIIELSRFRNLRYSARVAEYFLTPGELAEKEKREDPIEFMASRFAAKEAVIKALSIKLSPLEFKIAKLDRKPVVEFLNPKIMGYSISLSISHSLEYVASFAIAYQTQ